MGRIGTEDEGFVAQLGTAQAGSCGDGGFTDSAFAGHQNYAHDGIAFVSEETIAQCASIMAFFVKLFEACLR
jgi:hypothetical protein